jgi:hypothetical protein
MKKIGALLFLLLIVTSSAFGQWKKGDERAVDAPDRKSINGFGGHLLVVVPAGEYRVKPKVSDLNADVSLELETKFPFAVDR